ncbi:MAG: metal-dependent hydrolase [Candidatus Hydrogenedentota bacterium]
MPDLVTHIVSAWAIKGWDKQRLNTVFFIFGNMLPDIATRVIFIPFPSTYKYLFCIHSFFPLFIIILFIAEFINKDVRRDFIIWSYLGCVLHQVMDIFQYGIGGYALFFPFYNRLFAFSLIRLNYFYVLTIILLIIILTFSKIYIRKER